MIFMIGNDLNDGCLLEVGVGWGSPSGPFLPRALTPGPSPAERERGVDVVVQIRDCATSCWRERGCEGFLKDRKDVCCGVIGGL